MKKIALLFAVAACAATILPSCSKKVPDDDKKPYDEYAVDLGLSVKWASINVGATAEKDLGKYYGWGEVSDKGRQAYYWTADRDEDVDTFANGFGRFKDLPFTTIQYVCIGCSVRPVCSE